jgi:CRP/FNR family cyclic AMP-dependent transcriptional regulator
MTVSSVFDYRAGHPFLAGVPADRVRALAIHGRPVLRPVGRRLFRAGGPADRFWLLRSGAVALDFYVPGRGDVVIERDGAPGVVGWSWLLPPYQWALGGVVAEEGHAVQFNGAAVRALIEDDPIPPQREAGSIRWSGSADPARRCRPARVSDAGCAAASGRAGTAQSLTPSRGAQRRERPADESLTACLVRMWVAPDAARRRAVAGVWLERAARTRCAARAVPTDRGRCR